MSEAKYEVDDNAKWLELLAAALQNNKVYEHISSPECAGRVLAVRDQLLALEAENARLRMAVNQVRHNLAHSD